MFHFEQHHLIRGMIIITDGPSMPAQDRTQEVAHESNADEELVVTGAVWRS